MKADEKSFPSSAVLPTICGTLLKLPFLTAVVALVGSTVPSAIGATVPQSVAVVEPGSKVREPVPHLPPVGSTWMP